LPPLRLELPEAATELLAIVPYLTASDGRLYSTPDDTGRLSPWYERVLLKAMERLEVIDVYLRSRVAFYVADKDHGYGPFDGQLEPAGAALDSWTAATAVVDALLAGRLPTTWEFESMGDRALMIYPALEAIEDRQRKTASPVSKGYWSLATDDGGLRASVATVARVAQGLGDVVGHRQVTQQDAVQFVGQHRSLIQHARDLAEPVLDEEVRPDAQRLGEHRKDRIGGHRTRAFGQVVQIARRELGLVGQLAIAEMPLPHQTLEGEREPLL